MSKITLPERAGILRQAATRGRTYPGDIFGTRMAIHDAFAGTGVDYNRACDLLISAHPPLSESDCIRLELIAALMECETEAPTSQLFDFCEMARMMSPAC
ncbi:hypothetical protein PSCICM_26670 [Pseudomonas cichorii]|uniref:hypothetical protein n=1 Tax=Pseudomonas cichorii TaxID=36746 RepID=UPI00191096B1|nr:hypothetical protein [Pseudomonas cichorii]GFM76848.1 hypothetical protein PSCICM_26670 [Pseudomonas cichorii]